MTNDEDDDGRRLGDGWWIEGLALLGLMGAAAALFALTGIDLWVARWLRTTDGRWLVKEHPFWELVYDLDKLVVIALAAPAVAVLVGSYRWKPAWRPYRIYAVFVVATLLLGPLLLINEVLKNNWGRPRPKHLAEFGGTDGFSPYYVIVGPNRKRRSFASGHAAAGFSLICVYYCLRRRRPRWALVALLTTVGVWAALAYQRMGTGSHFASDVTWAALLTGATAWLVYYPMMRFPVREAALFPAPDAAYLEQPALVGGLVGCAISLALLGFVCAAALGR